MGHRRRSLGGWWEIVGALVAMVSALLAGCVPTPGARSTTRLPNIPRYQHIFLMVMENHEYDDIISSSQAPHLNALAQKYGLATNYWAVTHPSEPNYIAMLGGSFFGVIDDNSYTQNAIKSAYLGSQLEAARLTWKSYQQGLPSVGYAGEMATTGNMLYASKHNPFLNFLTYYPASQRAAEMANNVPETQLATDLASGAVPNFSLITPNLCADMHGDPACGDEDKLISAGDTFAYDTVSAIMASSIWSQGNNAIIITWDESTPGVSFGPGNITSDGGHVPTIVITSHGPRGLRDNAAYNHYALLLSIQDAFGLECLNNSCPTTGGVQPMEPLLAA
ncbi:MAG TPA: alkaline phosphatase family protein [Ktedonobacterales bacterium]